MLFRSKIFTADIEDLPPLIATGENEYISALAKREEKQELVQILDVKHIFDEIQIP